MRFIFEIIGLTIAGTLSLLLVGSFLFIILDTLKPGMASLPQNNSKVKMPEVKSPKEE